MFGPRLVAIDVLGRRLGSQRLAAHAQRRINAVEQSLVDQEVAGSVHRPPTSLRSRSVARIPSAPGCEAGLAGVRDATGGVTGHV